MTRTGQRVTRRVALAVVGGLLLTVLAATSSVAAQTLTWVGPVDGLWSTPANWSPVGPPQNGDSLMLPVGSRSLLDIAGLSVKDLSSESANGPFAIVSPVGSQVLSVAGNITGSLALRMPIELTAGAHRLAGPQFGPTALLGGVSGPGAVVTSGDAVYLGPGPLTYTGTTMVESGSLTVDGASIGFGPAGTTVQPSAQLELRSQEVTEHLTFAAGPGDASYFSALPGATVRGAMVVQGAVYVQIDQGLLDGPISGAGMILVGSGGGNGLRIAGGNTYSGGTELDGRVFIDDGSALGTGTITVHSNGELNLDGGADVAVPVNVPNEQSGAGARITARNGESVMSGLVTFAGHELVRVSVYDATLDFAAGLSSTAPVSLDGAGAANAVRFGGPATTPIPRLSINATSVLVATPPGRTAFEEVAIGQLSFPGQPASELRFTEDGQHGSTGSLLTTYTALIDLGGTDQAASIVEVIDGTLRLGDPATGATSTLTTAALHLFAGSQVEFVFSGTSSDVIRTQSVRLYESDISFVAFFDTPVGSVHTLIDNQGPSPVSGQFRGAPEGTEFEAGGGVFRLSYVGGNGNDVTLTRTAELASSWGGYVPIALGGRTTDAPSVSSWGPGRLDAWVVGTDRGLWHHWSDGISPGAWEPLGGVVQGSPAGVSQGYGRADVFVRGADNALWYRSYNNGWSPWRSLGGTITSAPAATSWGPGRIDVVARGGDGQVWHRAMNGSTWQPWQPLGGRTASPPAISNWGPGWVDVFVRGTDNAVWRRTMADGWGGSTGWTSLGGHVTDGPAVASSSPGQLALFVRGSDGLMYHRSYEGFGFSPWENYSVPLEQRPGAVGQGPERLFLAIREASGSVLAWRATQ